MWRCLSGCSRWCENLTVSKAEISHSRQEAIKVAARQCQAATLLTERSWMTLLERIEQIGAELRALEPRNEKNSNGPGE